MWNLGEIGAAQRPGGIDGWVHTNLMEQGGAVVRLSADVTIEVVPLDRLWSAFPFPPDGPREHDLGPRLDWERHGDHRIVRWSGSSRWPGLTVTSTWATNTNQVEPGHPAKWFTLDHELTVHADVPAAVRTSVRFQVHSLTENTGLRGLTGAWFRWSDGRLEPLPPLRDIPLGLLAGRDQPIRLVDFPTTIDVRSDWDGAMDSAAMSCSGYSALALDARQGLDLTPVTGPLTIGLPERESWTGRTRWRVTVDAPAHDGASTTDFDFSLGGQGRERPTSA